jgi:hypothetical protein
MLPPPAGLAGHSHHCLLALLHGGAEDPFTSTQVTPDILSPQYRLAAHKNLHVVPLPVTGAAPASSREWAAARVIGDAGGDVVRDLAIRRGGFPGTIWFVLPPKLHRQETGQPFPDVVGGGVGSPEAYAQYAQAKIPRLTAWERDGPFRADACRDLRVAVESCQGSPALVMARGAPELRVKGVRIPRRFSEFAFLGFECPRDARAGTAFDVECVQVDPATRKDTGGSTFRIEVVASPAP